MIKDKDGDVLTGFTSVMGRQKKYFEELMNEGSVREHRAEEVAVVEQEAEKISRDEGRKTLNGMKIVEALCPGNMKCAIQILSCTNLSPKKLKNKINIKQ